MYRLQLMPHSAYEQIAAVAEVGEAALTRMPCRGEVEMREERLLNELALLGCWDDLIAARAQDRDSVRVAVNTVQWRDWLRWAEDAAEELAGGNADKDTKTDTELDDLDSLLYNREDAAYRAELLESRMSFMRTIGLTSGDADDETDDTDVVWSPNDAQNAASSAVSVAPPSHKTRKTTVPPRVVSHTSAPDPSLTQALAASFRPAPSLGWGISPGSGGVANENDSVTVDTTFTMQYLPTLDEDAAKHYSAPSRPSVYNRGSIASAPVSPRSSVASPPVSPHASDASVLLADNTPSSPMASGPALSASPSLTPSPTPSPVSAPLISRALFQPLPQLPVTITAQKHNYLPSAAAVPLSPLPPPNPTVEPGSSLVQTSATARAQLLAALRQHTRIHTPHLLAFYDKYMPTTPRSLSNKLSAVFLILWSVLCGFLIVAYGLQFDMASEQYGNNTFDFGKDAGNNQSSLEWILNAFIALAFEVIVFVPFILLLDACIEARVQRKRDRERAQWEYEQAADIFVDPLQQAVSEDAMDHVSEGDDKWASACAAGDLEMVDLAVKHAQPLSSPPVVPPPPPSEPSSEVSTLPPPPPPPLAASTELASTELASAHVVATTPTKPANTSVNKSLERYRVLTERPDLTAADHRLMAVLQRMQVDFAPHHYYNAAALEYPLKSRFPILGHMRADTFLRLCASNMQLKSRISAVGIHNKLYKEKVKSETASADSAAPTGTTGTASASVTANADTLNISQVSWLNDRHSKRHERKKQADARKSKVSVSGTSVDNDDATSVTVITTHH